MKHFLILLVMAAGLAACGGSPEGQEVKASEAEEMAANTGDVVPVAVNTEASVVNWTGAKFTGDQHTGTIRLMKGNFITQDGKLVGGSFVLDMKSIANNDLPEEKKGDLVGHLLSDDFFNVEKFPTATFDITGLEAVAGNPDVTHKVTGNLMMKDISKSITFPAKIMQEGGKISANTPAFTIDRTEWNVMFGSTLAGAIKEKAIDEKVALQINLTSM